MSKNPQRLSAIVVMLPVGRQEEIQFFGFLFGLFAGVHNGSVSLGLGTLTFTPSFPAGAWPATSLQMANVPFPRVFFDTDKPIMVSVGRFVLSSLPAQVMPAVAAAGEETREGEIGAGGSPGKPMPLIELIAHLHGRINRIDHLGVVLPERQVSRDEWDGLLRDVASVANLYRYPTGEDWPFILPASAEEFARDITAFGAGREPKFELVYGAGVDRPVLQIDLETDMTRSEMESEFPAPYGFALPGLEDFFRSVYVEHPWPGLLIRFDLRYRSSGPPDEWDTGEWLVREGGRITPSSK